MNLNPKRLENEIFEDYKKRMKWNNKIAKQILRGRYVEHTRKEWYKIYNVK